MVVIMFMNNDLAKSAVLFNEIQNTMTARKRDRALF